MTTTRIGYYDMTDQEIEAAVLKIIQTSESQDEITTRIHEELDYDLGLAITIHLPTDSAGRLARDFVTLLGGATTKNGAMVMIMMHGHHGTIQI